MSSTNIQNFSGDVQIRGTTFIKANSNTNNIAIGTNAGETGQGADAVAVGYEAGETSQGSNATAVGRLAGATGQGSSATAVGRDAGKTGQGSAATAVGRDAGYTSQGASAVAVGNEAGLTGQGGSAVAVGVNAGETSQGFSATALGRTSGRYNQGSYATAVGQGAGTTSQGTQAVAVGLNAGQTGQGDSAVAVGRLAGQTSQGADATAVGYLAGQTSQGTQSVAVGYIAGRYNQGDYTVAVGYLAGSTGQGNLATAVGVAAGQTSQGASAVAVGQDAGQYNQGTSAVAVGLNAGETTQGGNAVAVGINAGSSVQGSNAVAVGYLAGNTSQGIHAVAVGYIAGRYNQGDYTVAAGREAGYQNQGDYAVGVGIYAGRYNQGADAIAIGRSAGPTSQHDNTIVLNASGVTVNTNEADAFFVKKLRNTGGTAMFYDTSSGEISYSTSDDRMKVKEVLIKDATTTLMKLSPQSYFKKFKLDEPNISHYESGLMAQDVWYDTPELRHVVHLGAYANPTPEKPPAPVLGDIQQDPDYSAWGSDPAQVQYDQLIPFTIKSIQEIVTELPRSKTTVSNAWGQNITGLVVSANTNKHKTNTVPLVSLSNVTMDKSWYGVVSDEKTDSTDYDTLVDTKGNSCIWVTDTQGPLESGDLVTTSNVAPGYAQKQEGDLIRSSTVAKVTQDCDFTEPTRRPIRVPKKELSNVTYYIEKTEVVADLYEYEQNLCERCKAVKTETVYRKIHTEGRDTIYFDINGNEVSKRKYDTLTENEKGSETKYDDLTISDYNDSTPEEQTEYTETIKNVYYRVDILESPIELEEGAYDETEVRQELVDILDENGQIVWEETGETEPVYTLVDHGTYKAALVSCKLI